MTTHPCPPYSPLLHPTPLTPAPPHRFTGQDWDPDLEEFTYYDLTADSANTLSMTDEVFLVQLKSKKSLAKVLSTSKDVVESTGELLYMPF